MAVTDYRIEAAKRYAHWSDIQKEKKSDSGKAAKEMVSNRLQFNGVQQINIDPGVFLETVLDGNDLLPVRYFEMGRLAARPVGRIHFDLGPRVGQGYGTGFLVAPGLMLTNHHVLPTADIAMVASITFDAEDGLNGLPLRPQVFRLDPKRGYFADSDLDFCFVAVEKTSTGGDQLSDLGYLKLHKGTGKILREEYATIIQHPRGRQKHVAARNNRINVYVYDRELTDEIAVKANNHIYYETDTLPGSSGAPVFSDQWYVVALHRRGVPKTKLLANNELVVIRKDDSFAKEGDPEESIEFVANEGIRISRIIRRLEEISSSGTATEKLTASQIVQKISKTTSTNDGGPFSIPVASINKHSADKGEQVALSELEVTRRKLDVFADAEGFDENFLGVPLRLPKLSRLLLDAAARRLDDPNEYLLPFQHFTTAMHAGRRLPIFAAANINGAKINKSAKPGRPSWSYDPRIDEAHQPDDSIFSKKLQRGHMAAREMLWWGTDAQAKLADVHSFTLTNVCPQIGRFNGNLEWRKLEAQLFATAKSKRQKVNCVVGPIFSKSDQPYDDLRSDSSDAEFDTGIRIPKKFWYLLAWLEGSKIKHRCFVLDQSDDIVDAGPLEFDFQTPATVEEVSLIEIEKLAKMTFTDLR